ncbi:MAG TPA: DnaJ domain-containing protein [Thermoanaerobaculia bacterium]|nr:DnaJ domain-containing protein [Thermoanaerobaculia bacterium]
MTTDHQPLSAHELTLFTERVGSGLHERPLELDVKEHREQVAALLSEFGDASFYQLLALEPVATPDKVHEGYERVARLVHPQHAFRLGLEGREAVLEVLFEQATLAYLTLSHPGRRRDYDRGLSPADWSATPAAKPRDDENRERALYYFKRAVVYAASEEYHFAIELLRDASRIDPQARYFALLGELQAKNVHWLRHAAESYARALQLGGPDPKVEAALLRVREKLAAEGAAGSPSKEA